MSESFQPQRSTLQRVKTRKGVGPEPENELYNGFPLSQDQIQQIFEAKCTDFNLKATEKVFSRFEKSILERPFRKVFSMENFSLGPLAATVVKNIVLGNNKFSLLMLSGNSFGNAGAKEVAEIIQYSKNVISIDLSANSIDDEGMSLLFQALKDNCHIYSFSVGSKTGINRNSISTNASRMISRMLSTNIVLSELDLTMVEITAENVKIIAEGLSHNRILSDLNLTNNNIQSKGMSFIVPYLIQCKLRVLKLGGNHLQDDCGTQFANFLKENVSLESIDLSNNGFTSRFISSIQSALSQCTTLKEINLSKNPLTGRGASVFGKILQVNSSITYLNLQACKIDPNGIAQFGEGFAFNTSLRVLILSNNPLRDDGMTKFSNSLTTQKGIKEIYLDLVEMSDNSCKEFFTKMGNSQTIKIISIKNNLIKDGEPILKALQKNKSIKQLYIEFNDISFAYIGQITRTLQETKAKETQKKHTQNTIDGKLISELEDELHQTRSLISIQRNCLESLQRELIIAKKEAEDTKASKINTLYVLETRDAELDKEIHSQRSDNRTILENIEGQVNIEKGTVENLSRTIQGEVEKFKGDKSFIGNIEKQMEKAKSDHINAMADLESKKIDTIENYKNAVYELKSAFREAKEGPLPTEVETTPEQATTTQKSPKKKKSKKGKKKAK